MPSLTKATLYTLAETAINALVNGSAYTLPAGSVRADVSLYVAAVTTTTPAAGTNLIVQGNFDASDDSKWFDLAKLTTGLTAAANTTVSSGNSIGDTTLAVAGSGTFGARSSLLYLRDTSGSGEWIKQTSHVSTTITFPSPGLRVAHSSSINLYDQAQKYWLSFDVVGLLRMRLTVDNNSQATGPTVAVFSEIDSYVYP